MGDDLIHILKLNLTQHKALYSFVMVFTLGSLDGELAVNMKHVASGVHCPNGGIRDWDGSPHL